MYIGWDSEIPQINNKGKYMSRNILILEGSELYIIPPDKINSSIMMRMKQYITMVA